MRFMNDYDIDQAYRRWADHPVLGPAIKQVEILKDFANANSDGWCYWPKPARAAARLMELIERDGTAKYAFDYDREDVSLAELKKALVPVKAFRTRCIQRGMPSFKIVEV